MEEMKNQTSSLINRVEDRRRDIETSLDLIDLMETDIQSSSVSQRDQIISFINQLKREAEQQIEQHKQILLQQLEDKSKEKLDRLAQQRKQLERDLDCFDNSVSFSRSLLKNATNQQLESHLPLITDQLNRLNEDETFNQPPVELTLLEANYKKDYINFKLSDVMKGVQVIEKRSKKTLDLLNKSKRQSFSNIGMEKELRNYKSIKTSKITFEPIQIESCEFDQPNGSAIDRDNNIIICDAQSPMVQLFDPNGRLIRSETFDDVMKGEECIISSIDVDHQNNIVMLEQESHQIIIFDMVSRQIIRRFGGTGKQDGEFGYPEDLCVDRLNRILVCDTENNRIQVFDHEGNHLFSFGSKGREDGQFDKPCAVTVNHLNNIIVCDSSNRRIQVFDEEGNHLFSFGTFGTLDGMLNCPQDVAVDHHNNILVCDRRNCRIQIYDPQGEWIHSIGSRGSKKGQLLLPRGVSVDHLNRFIVCDTVNNRVQIF